MQSYKKNIFRIRCIKVRNHFFAFLKANFPYLLTFSDKIKMSKSQPTIPFILGFLEGGVYLIHIFIINNKNTHYHHVNILYYILYYVIGILC